jgi:hypothetical protein
MDAKLAFYTLVMALGHIEKHRIALESVYLVHTVGVFAASTTCTCLSVTNNGIHDNILSVLVKLSQQQRQGVLSPWE